MRYILRQICCVVLLLCGFAFAQSSNVELKDTLGNLIGSFAGIQDAYNAVPDTSTGSYRIVILPSYTSSAEVFPIKFNYKKINSLVISPSADNSNCVISADTNASVLEFDSCSNVIIDGRPGGEGDTAGLMIGNKSADSAAYSINVINGSSNLVFRYLDVFNSTQADTFGRNISIGWAYSHGNDSIVIENCLIEGGRFGVISKGNPNAPNRNIHVLNNTIRSYGFCGVKIFTGTLSMTVYGNTIYMTDSYNVFIPVGVSISGTRRSVHNVIKNKIYNIQSSAASGISMRGIYCYEAEGSTVNIINNFISLPLTVPGDCNDVYGIWMMGTNDFSANILYNTIYIAGEHHGGTPGRVVSAGIMKTNVSDTARYTQLNNIIINKRTGGRTGVYHAAVVLENNSSNRLIDYNTYYCPEGEGRFVAGWDSLLFTNMDEYRSVSGEDSSNFHDVSFVSETDLHLSSSEKSDVLIRGKVLEDVTDDIDGDVRGSYPFRGADEIIFLTGTEEEGNTPLTYQLSQNFPNPFNPSTEIRYSVGEPGIVTIKLYDILGKEVSTILNEYKSPGNYSVSFSAQNLAAGVYLYRITSGSFKDTKKMVLLK